GSTYGAAVYDKNGNLTVQPAFGGVTTFAYDLNNRATSIAGGSINTMMKYFGDGKLAELNLANGVRRFLIDPSAAGNRVLAELDATGGVQTAYVYGPLGMLSQISDGQTLAYFH